MEFKKPTLIRGEGFLRRFGKLKGMYRIMENITNFRALYILYIGLGHFIFTSLSKVSYVFKYLQGFVFLLCTQVFITVSNRDYLRNISSCKQVEQCTKNLQFLSQQSIDVA